MAAVIALARLHGYRCFHTHDSRRSAAGFPDLVLVGRGRIIFAELKAEKGKLSPDQREWLGALRAAGGTTHVWLPSDWPEIVEMLAGRRA